MCEQKRKEMAMKHQLNINVDLLVKLQDTFRFTRGCDHSSWAVEDVERLTKGPILGQLLDVLHDRAEIINLDEGEMIKRREALIEVDRTIHPAYKYDGVLMHPELEETGPCVFSIKDLVPFYVAYPLQEALPFYEMLVNKEVIKNCLGLRDLEEIQKKGFLFFEKHFKGGEFSLIGWKSVVKLEHGESNFRYPLLGCGGGGSRYDEPRITWEAMTGSMYQWLPYESVTYVFPSKI